MNKGDLIYLKMSNGDSVFFNAKEIAEAGGGPLSFIYIDWQFNASTSILVSSETAEEFLNLLEGAIEIF